MWIEMGIYLGNPLEIRDLDMMSNTSPAWDLSMCLKSSNNELFLK
jgi:hypothetical protein